MSIKGLFFSLLTYLGLVWVLAAYRSEGPNATAQIRRFGLFWTAVGLAAVLAWIIGARLFAWWRARRARAAAAPKPAAPRPAAPVLNEDDQALVALLAEANAVLAKAPDYAGLANPIDSLPVYLLVGPEGSGKTSMFVNSSLTPALLAGNASAAVAPGATRIANIWLASGAIFIEIAGRIFSGDTGRFADFLRVLERGGKAATKRTGLRRLWQKPEAGLQLHGVLAFCEAKAFSGAPNPDKAARESRAWQEHLQAIAAVFGVEFPVYQVIAKSDSVAFYDEYFKRMPGPEAQQVLGCTLDQAELQPRHGEVSIDTVAKRLTSAFNGLFYALARRRVTHLAHEPDATRRPGVYEFPRELKRLRPALIQFLAETFRPTPLRTGPVLRGFYFTGIREVEAFAAEVGATRVDWSAADLASDATRLFRGDATQFFRPEDVRGGGSRGGTTREWMFTSDLLETVVLRDRPARKLARAASPIDGYRKPLVLTVCALCGLLCLVWVVSWNRNRAMLDDIRNVARIDVRAQDAKPTLADLRALDALREQTRILAQHERGRRPLFMRFGLYAGDRLLDPARRTYFLRFQQLILNGLDTAIASKLEGLPSDPPPDAAYAPVYAPLATHLMISSAACKADPALVATVLKSAADQIGVGGSAEGADLTRKQIDFYAEELRYGNPCRIAENALARDRARRYLANIKGPERIYAGIVSNVEKTIGKPQRLADVASNYATVLNGAGEVPGAFSLDGWTAFDKAAAQGSGDTGDACIVGAAGAESRVATADVSLAVKRLYAADYVQRWRNFVTGFSVLRYSGPEDAARKLEILSDHRSPLLAVLYMTAKQTSAAPAAAPADGLIEKARKTGSEVLSGITGDRTSEDASQAAQNGPIGRADLARIFQPVQVVVPAQSDTWITDKNGAYIEGLAQLARAMQAIAKNPTDAAAQQAAQQAHDKALDSVRQIARAFKPVGVQGIDTAVERLLEQPIQFARPFLIDPDKTAAVRINGELRSMCSGPGAVLHKYPFNATGEDATLQDVSRLLAPGAGALWQFQAQSLAEFVVKDGGVWKPKDPSKKPQVAPEMLALLNRAQKVSDALFPPGTPLPSATFVLRPRMDNASTVVIIDIDGQKHEWTNSLQKQFTWPTPAGAKPTGAVVRMRSGPATVPVASRGGVWGIFRVMADAEPRPAGSKVVEWKKVRAGDGRVEPVDPPVRLEIVEFPGGVDVFNPRFFDGFGCPVKAVQ